jgi:hypothetical protein
VQSDLKHFPFKVFSKNGKPYIQVEYRGETKEFVCVFSIIDFVIVLTNISVVPRRNLVDGSLEDEGDR